MTRNEILLKEAKDAIVNLFCDLSVSRAVTHDNIQELIDDCEGRIASLDLETRGRQ